MIDRFSLADLEVPIAAAPMAGGPSSPALAATVSSSGGLGFLAGGMLSADALAETITTARALTTGALGVNLFVPHKSVVDACALTRYGHRMAVEAKRYGVSIGTPAHHDFDWATKVDLLCDLRPEVASFTFGLPGHDACRRLHDAGVLVVGTVTNVDEALLAVDHGVDALTVQGPMAGGHRATFDPMAPPDPRPLDDLLGEITRRVEVDVMAAGGLTGPAEVSRVLDLGATAAQCGPHSCWPTRPGPNGCTAGHCAIRGSPRPSSPGPSPVAMRGRCATGSPSATTQSRCPDSRRSRC